MLELSANLLAEIGGWQVLKEARALVAAGRVKEVQRDGPTIRARVQGGEKIHDTQIILDCDPGQKIIGREASSRPRGISPGRRLPGRRSTHCRPWSKSADSRPWSNALTLARRVPGK